MGRRITLCTSSLALPRRTIDQPRSESVRPLEEGAQGQGRAPGRWVSSLSVTQHARMLTGWNRFRRAAASSTIYPSTLSICTSTITNDPLHPTLTFSNGGRGRRIIPGNKVALPQTLTCPSEAGQPYRRSAAHGPFSRTAETLFSFSTYCFARDSSRARGSRTNDYCRRCKAASRGGSGSPATLGGASVFLGGGGCRPTTRCSLSVLTCLSGGF